MSENRKPSFWDRLLGRDAEPVLMREPVPHSSPESRPDPSEAAAPEPETSAEPEARQTYEPDDAGPPETQAEWIEAGIPDAPEPEPDTPETVWDPFDATPETLAPEAEAVSLPQAGAESEPERKRSWLQRLSDGLRRSSDTLTTSIGAVFTKRRLDEATLQDLEDILIQADLGIATATAITDRLRAEKFDKDISTDEVHAILAE